VGCGLVLTGEIILARHLEDGEQEALIKWAKVAFINGTAHYVIDFLFAIPNGGRRNVREAARLKKQGVKAGVSDLFFAYPVAGKHGLWIEMKKQQKDFKSAAESLRSVSTNQQLWIQQMKAQGYEAEVAFGWADALEIINEYLGETT
jgi:hypothetical protein